MTQQPLHNREPALTPVRIAQLRPTQITVVIREGRDEAQIPAVTRVPRWQRVSGTARDAGAARPGAADPM